MFLSDIMNKDVSEFIKRGNKMPKPLDGPIECPEYFYSIMVDCWETKSEKRPNFKALHKIMENYFTHDTGESDEEEIYDEIFEEVDEEFHCDAGI